ncbi:MAG: hypothetical protein ACXVB9_10740 [Bdellovibrionota bacterium]
MKPRSPREWAEPLRKLRFFPDAEDGLIRFDQVTLPPAIDSLSLQIQAGSWVLLYGDDDFAKALFCDLCFSYIHPEQGAVQPCLRGSDVSFLGRSNTTYGRSLVDHIGCGVREITRELVEFTVNHVLSDRFKRHLASGSFEFKDGQFAHNLDLDERDLLEIAEANVLLQRRKAAVVDTTSDFYQIALEQGFRHSDVFLNSGKTVLWIIHDQQPLPSDAKYWDLPVYQGVRKLSLSFPAGDRAGFLN